MHFVRENRDISYPSYQFLYFYVHDYFSVYNIISLVSFSDKLQYYMFDHLLIH